ncbi:MAG: type II toxin-antitoxin system MqsA family antitoxin [Oscillospiraceae bacterium]|nr:type II toxin-antitoxin system MqsA family antitoxin [Oscillospiraceae bacterium]
MRCVYCNGLQENKESTFTLALDDRVIIIKNVPSNICRQCGEVSYDDAVFRHLEKLTAQLRDVVTEVAITSYLAKTG